MLPLSCEILAPDVDMQATYLPEKVKLVSRRIPTCPNCGTAMLCLGRRDMRLEWERRARRVTYRLTGTGTALGSFKAWGYSCGFLSASFRIQGYP